MYVIFTELTAAITLTMPLQNITWVTLTCEIPCSGIKAYVLSVADEKLYE